MFKIEGEAVSVIAVVVRRSKEAYADGWGFATVEDDSGREYKIVGSIAGIAESMTVCVEGVWQRHERYGMQIRIERIWEDDPRNEEGMISWMTKRLPQIGPKRAQEIVRKFGPDKMFHIIEYEAYKLTEIDGITEERAEEIVEAYREYKKEQESFVGLYRLGFNKAETNRIMKVWQENPLQAIRKNPFELYGTVRGFTFNRLDEIRYAVGLPDDFPPRLRTAIVDRAKKQCRDRGHTVREFEDFLHDVADQVDQDEELMMEYIGDLVQDCQLSFFERGVMLFTMDADEDEISTTIKELLRVGERRRRAVDERLGRGSEEGARSDGDSDEGSAGEGSTGSGGQAVAATDSSDGDAKEGAATSVDPDQTAFDLSYWGRQGAGVFADSGRRAGQGQRADAHRENGGHHRRPRNGEDNDPEANAR